MEDVEVGPDVAEHFLLDGEYRARNEITVKKYKSIKSGLSVYFCNVESPVINGYFAYGIDQPEAPGIETLLWQLDSSGGLLPRSMRSEMLRPAWQFHGAENPLADRDQSCYVCCALGETAFLGTFSCAVYLLQNIEAVFEAQGFMAPGSSESGPNTGEGGDQASPVEIPPEMKLEMEAGGDSEPKLNAREFYCLSEAGEGAMAWEATIQEMFSGSSPFWNRLLFEGKHKMSDKMRACYDAFYRPENLTVVITGTIEDQAHVLETLYEYEADYYNIRQPSLEFVRPWATEPLPPFRFGVETNVKFLPRNLGRKAKATLCFGWRGCPSSDVQTCYALKVLTAYASVGPLWDKFIIPQVAQRISWCLLEYIDTCALITIHGVESMENLDKIVATLKETLQALADDKHELLQLKEIQTMAERVGWHCIRELESEPALVLASCITKAERYGLGEPDQLKKRLEPTGVFEELAKKPLSYWKELVKKYFIEHGTFVTKVIPKNFDGSAEELPQDTPDASFQAEPGSERSFSNVSRRASSRPRSRANNPVGAEGFHLDEDILTPDPELKPPEVTELEKSIQNLSLGKTETETGDGQGNQLGCIERLYQEDPNHFPFGVFIEAAEGFEERLTTTSLFLDQIVDCEIRNYPVAQYCTSGPNQHPKFSVADLPFYTFLDDTSCSFVYLTSVLDTSHLNDLERNYVAVITAALGAVLCPRPPGLDTDADIKNPNEFNPPLLISDSQVSLGLNGEMMQNIFSTLIARPEHYKWAVGMMHYVLYEHEFTANFLNFVCQESAKALAYAYLRQTIDTPNYEYFDASEINLYSLIKLVYKNESNARLFVGRRRLDLLNEFLKTMAQNPEATTNAVNAAWRKIVDQGRSTFQIACDVNEMASKQDLVAPWKEYFKGIKKSREFEQSRPALDENMVNPPSPGSLGIAVAMKNVRSPCLTLAIPIDPTADYFPAICVCLQVYSMAHKWIWQCLEEEEPSQPALRMLCSFSSIVTLNLESTDIVGALKIMKRIMQDDWEWLNSLLIATKLMLVNDPTANEMGPQGAIALTLLTNLAKQSLSVRRDLMMSCLKVTLEDVKSVIRTHLSRLFDPKQAWCALMVWEDDQSKLIERLGSEFGLQFQTENLVELCSTI